MYDTAKPTAFSFYNFLRYSSYEVVIDRDGPFLWPLKDLCASRTLSKKYRHLSRRGQEEALEGNRHFPSLEGSRRAGFSVIFGVSANYILEGEGPTRPCRLFPFLLLPPSEDYLAFTLPLS